MGTLGVRCKKEPGCGQAVSSRTYAIRMHLSASPDDTLAPSHLELRALQLRWQLSGATVCCHGNAKFSVTTEASLTWSNGLTFNINSFFFCIKCMYKVSFSCFFFTVKVINHFYPFYCLLAWRGFLSSVRQCACPFGTTPWMRLLASQYSELSCNLFHFVLLVNS